MSTVKHTDLKEAGKQWIDKWLLPNKVVDEKRLEQRGLRRISTVCFRSTRFRYVDEFEIISLKEPIWVDLNEILSDITDKCRLCECCYWEVVSAGDIMDTLIVEVKELAHR